jgi:hypothetical protein
MKKTPLILILAATLLLSQCSEKATFDSDEIVLIDVTDSMALKPTLQDALAPLNLQNNQFHGVCISLSTINDKDVNPYAVLTLPSQNALTSNKLERQGQIEEFTADLKHKLDTMSFKKGSKHSVVYNAIARACNELAASGAQHLNCLIFSDLRENSALSFYKSSTIDSLQKHPESIESRLNQTTPLPNLRGLNVYLEYQPRSYADNEQYMIIARFFKHLMEKHGATVKITNNISAP